MSMWFRRGRLIAVLLLFVATSAGSFASAAAAASPANPSDFSLQVTPSPLVTTVKPGISSSVDLRIRNAGSGSENLKIETRAFKLNKDGSNVRLSDTTPPDISQWVSFSQPRFHIDPGQWFSESVRFSLPKEAGFSYSFALVISRQTETKPTSAGRLIKGSVAVFTLVNVDRPGATRQLTAAKLTTDHHLYEFLPATIKVTLQNTGNTIVQPYGNIFIGRGSATKKPLASLPVNEQRGYILPGISRTLATNWTNGFPVYKTTTDADGSQSRSLSINWSDVSKFRIGKYTAKLVAVYDDGKGHDVPVESEVSFWVIPWRSILLLLVVIAALWFFSHWRGQRRTEKAVQRALAAAKHSSKDGPTT